MHSSRGTHNNKLVPWLARFAVFCAVVWLGVFLYNMDSLTEQPSVEVEAGPMASKFYALKQKEAAMHQKNFIGVETPLVDVREDLKSKANLVAQEKWALKVKQEKLRHDAHHKVAKFEVDLPGSNIIHHANDVKVS